MSRPLKLRTFATPYPNPHDYGGFRPCPGAEMSPEFREASRGSKEDLEKVGTLTEAREYIDPAWVVCLYKADIIDRETARTLLEGLKRVIAAGKSGGGETSLILELGDEDMGSLVSLGRTLQEPMSRMGLRNQMLDYFDYFFELLDTLLDRIEAHAETIMQGFTHMSQGQPITLASYLLSIFDNMTRGLEQLELAYTSVNRNSGACGSTSGITWPVDRWLLTELLGFDDLVEPTYDCEASQDHTLSLLFALSNIMVAISRSAMDFEIWGMEETGMIKMQPGWLGQSSYMPQKAHPGSRMEHIRNYANAVTTEMMSAVSGIKNEPHMDTLTVIGVVGNGQRALASSKAGIRIYTGVLKNMIPQKERMLKNAGEGFSCASEVVAYLVEHLGYGHRRGHRITGTFVRQAREQQVTADNTTGDMLDLAAESIGEEPPGLDTETLRRLLDPVHFIHTHCNTGGPAPSETMRMLASRQALVEAARARHRERMTRVQKGLSKLQTEIETILDA